jgi:hypothetical protein
MGGVRESAVGQAVLEGGGGRVGEHCGVAVLPFEVEFVLVGRLVRLVSSFLQTCYHLYIATKEEIEGYSQRQSDKFLTQQYS